MACWSDSRREREKLKSSVDSTIQWTPKRKSLWLILGFSISNTNGVPSLPHCIVRLLLYSYNLLSPLYLFSCLSSIEKLEGKQFLSCQPTAALLQSSSAAPLHRTNMPHLNAETKHAILLEYTPRSATHSFVALAQRHGIAGGAKVLQRWHARWDATAASMKEGKSSGRPRVLNRAQVSRHVRAPILAANRAHRAIHYSELLPTVRQKTGTEVSLRSLQRYGKEELGAKQKHTKKRTAAESKSTAV